MTWLLIVPLALLGSEAAHGLDFWLAAPDPADRARLLQSTGHGGEGFVPMAIAFCGLLLLLALVGRALEARCTEPSARLSFAPFAFLPLLAFALRELMERSSEHGELVLRTFTEPIVLSGLALQLPFALLAFLVGRALLSAVDRLGSALVGERRTPRLALSTVSLLPVATDVQRPSPLAFAVSGRGPPFRR